MFIFLSSVSFRGISSTIVDTKGRRQNGQQDLAEDCQILLVTLQKPASY